MMYDGDSATPSSSSTWRLVINYIACYLLWILIGAIGVWIIFLVRRNLVEDLFFLQVNPWQLRAIDRWAIFGFGMVWVVAIFLIEGYLRHAVEKGKLWQRAGRILLIQATIAATSLLISRIA